MIKYAICGNIASGKSEAEKIISSFGYKVLDTDKVAHNLLEMHSARIKEEFSEHDITDNGKISRLKLGKIVFSDKELKKKLENILHPLIKTEIEEYFNKNKNEDKIFVSIPLLFESNMQNMFDKIILIYTDDDIRLKRLIHRNKFSEEYAKIRMNSQIPQDEKIKYSDIVVYNNFSLKEFEDNIKTIIL